MRVAMATEAMPDLDGALFAVALGLAAYASGYTTEGYEPHKLWWRATAELLTARLTPPTRWQAAASNARSGLPFGDEDEDEGEDEGEGEDEDGERDGSVRPA